jgi:8-oxo-dGTP pyrophosphatase MutT (NUDIX family)
MEKRKVQVVLYYKARNNKKNFLLLKTNEKRGYFWQNVTGSVDEGENFRDAAIREAKEETGIKNKDIKTVLTTDLKFKFKDRFQKNVIEKVFFIIAHEKWEVKIDPKEHCEYHWVNEDDLHEEQVHYENNWLSLELARDL